MENQESISQLKLSHFAVTQQSHMDLEFLERRNEINYLAFIDWHRLHCFIASCAPLTAWPWSLTYCYEINDRMLHFENGRRSGVHDGDAWRFSISLHRQAARKNCERFTATE